MNFINILVQNGQVIRGSLGSDISDQKQIDAAKKNDITTACGIFSTGGNILLDKNMPPAFIETMTSKSESPAMHTAVLNIESIGNGIQRAFLDVGGRGSTSPYAFSMSPIRAYPALYEKIPPYMKLVLPREIKVGKNPKFIKIREMALVIQKWGSPISHNPLYLQVTLNEVIAVDNFSALLVNEDSILTDLQEILVNVELTVPRFIGTYPKFDSSFQLKNPKLKNGYMLSMIKSVVHGSLFGKNLDYNALGYAGTVQYIGSADVGFFQTEFIYSLNFSVASYDMFNLNSQPLPFRESSGLMIDLSLPVTFFEHDHRSLALHEWVVGNWSIEHVNGWLSDYSHSCSMRNIIIMLPPQGKMSYDEHRCLLRSLYSQNKVFLERFYYAFEYSDSYIKHHYGYTKPYQEYYIPVYDDSFGTSGLGGITDQDKHNRRTQSIKIMQSDKIGIFKFPISDDYVIHKNTDDYLIPALFGGEGEVYLSSTYFFSNRFFEYCLKNLSVVGVNSLSNTENPRPDNVVSLALDHFRNLYMTVRYSEDEILHSYSTRPSIWSPENKRYDWSVSQYFIRTNAKRKVVIMPLAAFTALAGSSVTNRSLLLVTTNMDVLKLDIGSYLAKGTGIMLRMITGLSGDDYYNFRRSHINMGAKLLGQKQNTDDMSGHLFSMLFYPCSHNVYEAYIATAISRGWHTVSELRNSLLAAISIAELYSIPMHHLTFSNLSNLLLFTSCAISCRRITLLSL